MKITQINKNMKNVALEMVCFWCCFWSISVSSLIQGSPHSIEEAYEDFLVYNHKLIVSEEVLIMNYFSFWGWPCSKIFLHTFWLQEQPPIKNFFQYRNKPSNKIILLQEQPLINLVHRRTTFYQKKISLQKQQKLQKKIFVTRTSSHQKNIFHYRNKVLSKKIITRSSWEWNNFV